MRFWVALLIVATLLMTTSVRSTESDDLGGHSVWVIDRGAYENDESWPKYELARKHCDTDSSSPWERGRFAHWDKIGAMSNFKCYTMKCESKAYRRAANAQISCDVARFQACAGLDRKAWNLYWKLKFRSGLQNHCY